MKVRATAGSLLIAMLLALVVAAGPARAERALLSTQFLLTREEPFNFIPPPEGQIEGACGLAVSASGFDLYVSDYYHHVVDVFSAGSGAYDSQIPAAVPPGVPPAIPPEGPCALALDSTGNLYANYWHERVVRLKPGKAQMFDAEDSTGVAVDAAKNVYVSNRTHVTVYDSSGTQLAQIGDGSIGDGYGVAVDPAGTRVYVPDAEDSTVKVFEPALDPLEPAFEIDGSATPQKSFVSLVNAGLTVDPTNGHLLLADNSQPEFEHPEAAIYEFTASGDFLSQLPCAPIHGEPTGLAVNPVTGGLYVTTGNGEKSNVFAYGPYVESAPPVVCKTTTFSLEGPPTVSAAASSRGAATGPSAVASEIVQRRGVRVRFDGKLAPRTLPRHGAAPVGIAVDVEISSTGGADPPQLRRIAIGINRHGRFTSRGLPLCQLRDIQPSTTANALAVCRESLVGQGHFSADVKLPEQSPFPSDGKVLAFNGRLGGKPVILAHIYGTKPVPTSYVLPFAMTGSQGTYGTVLAASMPEVTGDWGYVTGLRMTLRRIFSFRGRRHSYLSAGCPAPAGFPSVVFPLARTSFDFAGGTTLVSILSRSCKARG